MGAEALEAPVEKCCAVVRLCVVRGHVPGKLLALFVAGAVCCLNKQCVFGVLHRPSS